MTPNTTSNNDREQCPECDTLGEKNRVVSGDEEWGCPNCKNTWWIKND